MVCSLAWEAVELTLGYRLHLPVRGPRPYRFRNDDRGCSRTNAWRFSTFPRRRLPAFFSKASTVLFSHLTHVTFKHRRLRMTGTEQRTPQGAAGRGTQPGPPAVCGPRRNCTALYEAVPPAMAQPGPRAAGATRRRMHITLRDSERSHRCPRDAEIVCFQSLPQVTVDDSQRSIINQEHSIDNLTLEVRV